MVYKMEAYTTLVQIISRTSSGTSGGVTALVCFSLVATMDLVCGDSFVVVCASLVIKKLVVGVKKFAPVV